MVDYSESGSCINFTVEYSNPCSSSKTITVTGGAEANTSTGMEMTTSTTVTIGTGSGSTSGRMCFQAGQERRMRLVPQVDNADNVYTIKRRG